MLIIGIAIMSIKYTFILDVYGAGRYLLGGSFLIIFFLGEYFGSLNFKFTKISQEVISCILSCIFSCIWFRILLVHQAQIDALFPFLEGINPPGICYMVYGILIVWVMFSFFSLLNDCKLKLMNKVVSIFSFLGSYSLYIFLYHKLIISLLVKKIELNNIFLKRIIYLGMMIFIPILMKIIFDFIKRKYIKFLCLVNTEKWNIIDKSNDMEENNKIN